MIHIYSKETTNRLVYALELVFGHMLGEKFSIYNHPEEFVQVSGVKINYSIHHELPGLQIFPVSLLFECDIKPQTINVFKWTDDMPAFFKSGEAPIPFDIFAASFYLVSRYEEYLSSERDKHGRFQPQFSLAVIHRFIDKPLVNYWTKELASIIEGRHNGFKFKKSHFSYQPTFDIDNAWAFKNKGVCRQLSSALRDMLKGNFHLLSKRIKVILNKETDPYDNYQYMKEIMDNYGFKPIIFFLLSNQGKYDRGISPRNRVFKQLIGFWGKYAMLGIHPSYRSNFQTTILKKEVAILHALIGGPVVRSRQHYLMLNLPKTYLQLAKNGILHDYSMGYASVPGFRASICIPFPFFDVLNNQSTKVMVHPFVVMDVTFRYYLHCEPEEAISKIDYLLQQVKNVGGQFISVWHNESLSNSGLWENWQKVYDEMTKFAFKACKIKIEND